MTVDVATWTSVAEVIAGCECGWGSSARNALANAKRHATASGHVVCVLQQLSVTYAPRGMTREEIAPRASAAFDAQDNAA